VITQRFAILEVVHTLGGAYILAGFFVLGISAWHLLRGQNVAFFRKSFALAATWSLVFALLEVAQGHMNAEILGTKQPVKLAAMEAQWATQAGAPMNLVQWPDERNERNTVQTLAVPKLLSLLAHYDPDAEVKGLLDVPREDRPPVLPTFLSFRAMVGLAFVFIALSAWAFARRRAPEKSTLLLRLLVLAIPLAYIANELGWTLSELGRQPWIVYGVMRTADAVSPISTVQVALSALGFIVVYSLLGLADFYLLFKYARRGPVDEPLATRAREV
jgi:cytochrome bd ubiquinol oxidase subunit I